MDLSLRQQTKVENILEEYKQAARIAAYDVLGKSNFKIRVIPMVKNQLDAIRDLDILKALASGDINVIRKNHIVQQIRDEFFSRQFTPVISSQLSSHGLQNLEDDINQQALSVFEKNIHAVIEDWVRASAKDLAKDILAEVKKSPKVKEILPKILARQEVENFQTNLQREISSIFDAVNFKQKEYLYRVYEKSYNEGKAAVGSNFLSDPQSIVYQTLKSDFFLETEEVKKGDIGFLNLLIARNPQAAEKVLNLSSFENYPLAMYEQNFIDWSPSDLNPAQLDGLALSENDVQILAKKSYGRGVMFQITNLAAKALAEMAKKLRRVDFESL
jgi:hypothetical protein